MVMSDSGSKIIPPDEAEVRRWQAPPVGEGGDTTRSDEAGTAEQLLSADRIAAIEEQARTEGYNAGFAQGREAGLAGGRQEAQSEAAQLGALFEAISDQVGVLDDALLEQISSLVLAVAKQFIRRELRSQPGEVVWVVREALRELPVSEARVRVYLHPEDLVLVRDTLAPESVERPLRMLEDMTLTRGGARLETESSVLDASVEKRLSVIAARLLGGERQAESGSLDPMDAPVLGPESDE